MSRQNHTQTISKAQIKFLSDLAYQFLRMRPDSTDSSVHAGFIFPGENEEVVKLIMERWVQWKDRLLDDLPEHSPEYAKLFGSRGITFEEFKLITMPQIGEEVMKDQGRAFDYFYLIDKTAQIVFSSKVDNENKTTFENYFDLLLPFLTNEIPVLSAFFCKKSFRCTSQSRKD